MEVFRRVKDVAVEVAGMGYITGISAESLSEIIDWLVRERGQSYSEAVYIIKGLLFGDVLVKEDYYEQESRKETGIAEGNDPEASA